MRRILYADDDTESSTLLWRLRAPSLFIGLACGVMISFATSRFEEILTHNVQVAFFLPFIVYMAAAVGEQTEAIYSRDTRSGKAKFHNYLVKESILSVVFGSTFGVLAGAIVEIWLGNQALAMAVGLSMAAAVAAAPMVALMTTEALVLLRKDPAASSAPLFTVVQDTISVIIYGLVSTAVLLN